MPFDSPHWTLVESIVWIATRDERRVDALTLIGRNSLILLYTDMEGSAKLSGKEGRKARTELINALGVSKFVATGIVLAEAARTEIPSFDWPNIRLSESRHFNSVAWEFNRRVVDEAYIVAQQKIAGQIIREWRDVRVSRTAVLGEWPRAERTVQTLSADADIQTVPAASARTAPPLQGAPPSPFITVQAKHHQQAPADQNRITASVPAKEDLSQANQQQAGASYRPPLAVAADSIVPDAEEPTRPISVPETEKKYPSLRFRKDQLDRLLHQIHTDELTPPPEVARVLRTGRASFGDKARCTDWIRERLLWPPKSGRNDTGDKAVRDLLDSIDQAGGLACYVGKLRRP
jgi:hypothetical protein